jgi:hypothetical protein
VNNMADKTTGSNPYRGFKFAYTTHGGPPAMDSVALVSDIYYPGQVLRISGTTGSAAVAAAAGTSVAYVASAYLTAAQAVVGKHPVYRLDDCNVFKAQMGASSTPQTVVGDTVDLCVGSTENHYLQGTSSTKVFSIIGFPGDEAVSAATNHNYYVKAARSVWATTKSDSSK